MDKGGDRPAPACLAGEPGSRRKQDMDLSLGLSVRLEGHRMQDREASTSTH